MFRFRPPFASATPPSMRLHRTVTLESVSFAPDARTPCTDDAVCVHVDYDRHPLGVHEYEHYIAKIERDERFHIR